MWFEKDELHYLGHVVGKEGIKWILEILKFVTKWRRPLEIGQLWSFLGLCNYFCGFIHEYCNLVALLTSLTWSKTMFIWREDCECAFETIKFALTHVSILTLPKLGKPFEVNNDASLMVNLVSRRKTYCLWK